LLCLSPLNVISYVLEYSTASGNVVKGEVAEYAISHRSEIWHS